MSVSFFVSDPVLLVATVLTFFSMLAVLPTAAYLAYIDVPVLVVLFCLMAVVRELQRLKCFLALGDWIVGRTVNRRTLYLTLVALCFFLSMAVTNDVVLITFVPFSLSLLQRTALSRDMIALVVLETVAANLGSMLTPIGNPQNLYLYSVSGMSIGSFLQLMFPLVAVSFILLMLIGCYYRNDALPLVPIKKENAQLNWHKIAICGILFLFCLATVLRIVPYTVCLIVVIVVLALMDWQVLREVDYRLLATFVVLFVFVGNIGRMVEVRQVLASVIGGHEFLAAVVVSQIISNVPAAMLLSGFTTAYDKLLLGVNVGSLGTLVASMASLISYRYYGQVSGAHKWKYLLVFTVVNIVFLAVLGLASM